MQGADQEDSKSLWKPLYIENDEIAKKVCSKHIGGHANHEKCAYINTSPKNHRTRGCTSSHTDDDSESISTKSIGQDSDPHEKSKSCLSGTKRVDHFEAVKSRWALEFGRGIHHYRHSVDAMHARSCNAGLCTGSDTGNLLNDFFLALDKFVYIANQCLKSTYIQDEDFNFALSWIRNAFQSLGIDGARHYANNYSGPYDGWAVDIEFLMNRYFFSPEFNHVNGFGIKEPMYEGCRFVENQGNNFCLSYVPYPGYYDTDDGSKQFCSKCKLMLPPHLSSSRGANNDDTNECS
ncbi:hypothetical protein HK407_12g17070 [Ordospora pajunii]|uniref:uncharacterized protein n=1 Tax=Ordospora pajunii TaxID=3039483 RepID=UPI00295267BA|nr:uncharacterized protein HK407_12g17070 [Ordospora pajunii]KAH9410576.1 hypothetical protein HK407_12g17070 [Ordospora pajunii]